MHFLAQVKRNVRIIDETEANLANAYSRTRVVDPTEKEKIYNNEECSVPASALADVIEVEEDRMADEDNEGEENGNFDMVSEWLDALEEENVANLYEEAESIISDEDYSYDIKQMKFSNRRNYRVEHPLPNWDDPTVAQEQLKGLHNCKITLHELFDNNDIKIPEIIDKKLLS